MEQINECGPSIESLLCAKMTSCAKMMVDETAMDRQKFTVFSVWNSITIEMNSKKQYLHSSYFY